MRRIYYTETIIRGDVKFVYERRQTKHGWCERMTTYDPDLHFIYTSRHIQRYYGVSLLWGDIWKDYQHLNIAQMCDQLWFKR